MDRTSQIAAGLLAAIMVIPAMTWAQGRALALGKNGDVELTAVTRIGPVTLQPGHYRFRYHEEDGRHSLIVRMRNEERRDGGRYAVGSGTEVGRVECVLIPLGQKIRQTKLLLTTDPDGTSRIARIQIKGEAAGHVIALGPKG